MLSEIEAVPMPTKTHENVKARASSVARKKKVMGVQVWAWVDRKCVKSTRVNLHHDRLMRKVFQTNLSPIREIRSALFSGTFPIATTHL